MDKNLREIAKDIRCDVLTCIGHLGVGHIGGCLSVVELLTVLYFEAMHIDPKEPKMAGRDRFICSKGHAGPAVYATLANRGYFDKKELLTLNQGGTNLPSHCDMNRTVGVDMTTGSLGQGFSCAVGVALGSKLEGDGATIYTLIGDGSHSAVPRTEGSAETERERPTPKLRTPVELNEEQLQNAPEEFEEVLEDDSTGVPGWLKGVFLLLISLLLSAMTFYAVASDVIGKIF